MDAKVTIYEVLYDAAPAGPAGDGTHIRRTRSRRDAEAFAAANTAWGRPTKASPRTVSAQLARRWGL